MGVEWIVEFEQILNIEIIKYIFLKKQVLSEGDTNGWYQWEEISP